MPSIFITLQEADAGQDLAEAGLGFEGDSRRNAPRVLRVGEVQLRAGWQDHPVGMRITTGSNREVILPWHRIFSVRLDG
jgi:hypothetical protein